MHQAMHIPVRAAAWSIIQPATLLMKANWWAQRDGAVVKVLALHARDPIWAPVLIPAAPLPIQLPACGPGGVNHRMEDLPLCLSSLYICLSNKNK